VTSISRRFCPCQAGGQAATARSRMVRDGSGTIDCSCSLTNLPQRTRTSSYGGLLAEYARGRMSWLPRTGPVHAKQAARPQQLALGWLGTDLAPSIAQLQYTLGPFCFSEPTSCSLTNLPQRTRTSSYGGLLAEYARGRMSWLLGREEASSHYSYLLPEGEGLDPHVWSHHNTPP
jgi:hypothetical protein